MRKNTKNTKEKGREYGKILGIKMTSTTLSKVLASVRSSISHNKKFYIVTPNPELVLMSEKDPTLVNTINQAKFAIPDGVGLNYASRFLYGESISIIPGRKLFESLIKLANKMGWKVFFLGGVNDEAEKAAHKLRLNYKKIKIETFKGPVLNADAEPVSEVNRLIQIDAIVRINDFKPQLLFVAFGNPKQEKWIRNNLGRLKIGCAMAVGGTFRYVAGYAKLPPEWMEKIGLEWLWRLIMEPKRFGRVFNAIVTFPLAVVSSKLNSR